MTHNSAPPSFIQTLPEEATFVSDDMDLNLKCQVGKCLIVNYFKFFSKVECSPLCSIKWMKNEELITNDGDKYSIEEAVIPEDIDTNQFQSVISKLSWNFDNLADSKLDHNELNFTILCFVEETKTGAAISSSLQIEVECKIVHILFNSNYIIFQMLQKTLRFPPPLFQLKIMNL